MSKIKIKSPAGTPGKVTSHFGPTTIVFEDGVGYVDEMSDGLRAYLGSAGYGIGGADATPPVVPEPVDPREHGREDNGTPLRDASVDPEPGDFLPPTNAGQANPHGPDVVSPGIHANQGVRPIKGGDVIFDNDPARQSQSETEHAAAATDGTPVTLTDDEKDLLGITDSETAPAKKAAAKKAPAKKAAAKKAPAKKTTAKKA